jgi:hypothetical protein
MPNRSLLVRHFLFVAGAILLSSTSASAQSVDTAASNRLGSSSAEIWVGYSPTSTSAGVLGRHGDVSLGLVGMRFNRRIRALETKFVYYSFDAIPVARVTPLIVYSGDAAKVCPGPYYDCRRITTVARGVGFNPIGVTVITQGNPRVQWRLGATGGALIFDRRTPSDLASRFNFTAAIEAGVQWVNADGKGWTLVYHLHHLSNAGTAEDNLAMLSHVISIGGRWRVSR